MGKLGVDPEKLKVKIVSQSNIYELKFIGFYPKRNAKGDSVNLGAVFEIIGDTSNPQNNGARVFFNGSLKFEQAIQDMVHAFGLTMEADGSIPGEWVGNDDPSSDPSTWKYNGPLSGHVIRAEIEPGDYDGRPQNQLKRFVCSVPNCVTRFPDIVHSQNLNKGKK